MSRVALIDAGGANLGSVRFALERLGAQVDIARDVDALRHADRIVLPGVGAAATAMALLRERGFIEVLRASHTPLLGICLGMQLLFERSEEGNVDCLGLMPGVVRRMQPATGVRIPHMGWNTLALQRHSPLLVGIADGDHAYFVHSYAVPADDDEKHCIATCSHGQPFAAIVQHGHVCAAQFHPERSAVTGMRLLSNFMKWSP